jgi:hypothetical protein
MSGLRVWAVLMVLESVCGLAKAQKLRPVVGQLLNVRGVIMLRRNGENKQEEAKTAQSVRSGDILHVRKGAQAELLLDANGSRWALAAESRVRVESDKVPKLSGSAPQPLAKVGATLTRGAREGERVAATTLRGNRGGAKPVGWTRAVPPKLEWETLEGTELTVVVQQGGRIVWESGLLRDGTTECEVPMGVLKPGIWYAWCAKTREDTETHTCGGSFRVQAPDDEKVLAKMVLEANALRFTQPKDPTPDLLLSQAYAGLGRYAEALAACDAAQKRRTDDKGLQEWGDTLRSLLPAPSKEKQDAP